MKLSVVLIARNEEALIGRCLKSVSGADEIIVLDTGSTDRTAGLASESGAKVIAKEYVWEDSFCKARNKAKSYASGDWILSIDADEFLEPDGIDKVRRAIENAGDATVIDIYLESENGKERHRFPRLFKNCPEINWCGSIHNYLNKVADKWEDIVITYGYSPTHGTDPDRSLRLLEQAVIDEPKSSRNWYYLGREYQYKHRWAASEVALRKALDMSRWSPEIADSRFLMARALWNLQRGNEAREECLKAIGVNPNFKEALLFMGDMCYPGSRSAWHRYAGTATNEGLLFVRVK